MNFSKKILAVVIGMTINGTLAMAAFSNTEVHNASAIAVADFSRANPTHAEHFTGYKVWKSGEDVKVKVYVAHDGMTMEFNYVCHKHEAAVECHFQP